MVSCKKKKQNNGPKTDAKNHARVQQNKKKMRNWYVLRRVRVYYNNVISYTKRANLKKKIIRVARVWTTIGARTRFTRPCSAAIRANTVGAVRFSRKRRGGARDTKLLRREMTTVTVSVGHCYYHRSSHTHSGSDTWHGPTDSGLKWKLLRAAATAAVTTTTI